MDQVEYGKHTIEYVSERIDGIHERLNELTRVTVRNLCARNAQLTAENERLQRVVEIVKELEKLSEYTDQMKAYENGKSDFNAGYASGMEQVRKCIAYYSKEAQLKGADRG